MRQSEQRDIVEGAVSRIAEMNLARDDDFQDKAMGELELAYDTFRPPPNERQPGIERDPYAFESDFAALGDDEMLDALRDIERDLEASPERIAELCDRALALVREQPSAAV